MGKQFVSHAIQRLFLFKELIFLCLINFQKKI
nr:MAG TPA: hypothetical protein [Caudoviricetes sp.]